MSDNRTMVKANVGNDTNETIEAIQDEYGMNKTEATEYLLGYGSAAYNTWNGEEHRLAGAEPTQVPGDAPRDEDGDPENL